MTLGRFYGRALGLFRGLWNWWAEAPPPVTGSTHCIHASFPEHSIEATFPTVSISATVPVITIQGVVGEPCN